MSLDCVRAITTPGLSRRGLLQATAAWLAIGCGAARAQSTRVPLADMHSHYGLITRSLATSGLADELRNQRVALMAWKLVSDGPWLREGKTGIEVVRTPEPGQLAATFDTRIARMKAYLREQRLKTVLTAADVDACIAANGEPGIVLASEGAHFLEGRVDNLKAARDKGLRHLQLVHFLPSPVGDNQTLKPVHDGLSAIGKSLVEACNAQHMLIDLAHASMDVVEQAVQISKAPLIWSHGWVGRAAGRWLDATTYQQRRMSISHAKMIADKGGVVGLWGFALNKPAAAWAAGSGSWTVGLHDTRGLRPRAGRPDRQARQRSRGHRHRHRRRGQELVGQRLCRRAGGARPPAGDEAAERDDRACGVRQLCPGVEGGVAVAEGREAADVSSKVGKLFPGRGSEFSRQLSLEHAAGRQLCRGTLFGGDVHRAPAGRQCVVSQCR